VRELRKTEEAREVERNFGALQWSQVILMEQEGSDWQVLAVPIRANTRESQALLAGTRDGKEFVVLVLGVTYEGGTVDYSAGFTGSLDFYNPTGEVAITARFSGGELQDVEKLMDLHRSPGLNWDCFVECLVEIGRELLPQCVAACVLCAGVPIPYNPACWACAACIGGGSAFWCIVACWE
jgi:hypothetical protein